MAAAPGVRRGEIVEKGHVSSDQAALGGLVMAGQGGAATVERSAVIPDVGGQLDHSERDDLGSKSVPSSDPIYCCTFGSYNQTGPWTDVRALSWPELKVLLITHQTGPKEGTCIVPATFRGPHRHKADAQRIDVAFLDSDTGASLADIRGAIERRGWAAIISSTHSHMATRTTVGRAGWDRFIAGHPDPVTAPAAFLQSERSYADAVAKGARIVAETSRDIIIEHQPCPKFRIAIPLSIPWIASDYDTQDDANDAWRERIEALAAAIDLNHDQACTDTSRLFFLPRRPTDDAPVETFVLHGASCNIFGLPTPKPRPGLFPSQDMSSSGIDRGSLSFRDPVSQIEFDLTEWSRTFARQFELAAALQTRNPSAFVGKAVSSGKHHIRCVNEGAHTQSGEDAATIVINASESTNRGFVYHCRHAHCTGVDRLMFIRQMLERQWLTVPDLTDPAFQSSDQDETGCDEAPADDRQFRALAIGSDAEIGQRVVEDLKRRFGQVVHDDGAFWVHNGRHWEALAEAELWHCAFVYDGARYHTPKGDPANVKMSQGRVTSILACMVPLVTRARFFAESATGINCTSGFIVFASDGTPRLVPHSPEHRQRHVLAGRWPTNPDPLVKQQSLLHRLLDGCFSGDEDKRAKIDLLAEVAGIAALGRATRIIEPKALVCFGKHAENGKSQVLAMVRSLLPAAAVSNISPGKVDDRTFTCHLVGKLLNAPDELAGSEAIASDCQSALNSFHQTASKSFHFIRLISAVFCVA